MYFKAMSPKRIIDYIEEKEKELGKKKKRAWKKSIRNMVRYGAKISEKEQKILNVRPNSCLRRKLRKTTAGSW